MQPMAPPNPDAPMSKMQKSYQVDGGMEHETAPMDMAGHDWTGRHNCTKAPKDAPHQRHDINASDAHNAIGGRYG